MGIRLSKTSVTQKIDLSDVVGKDISNDPLLVRKIAQGIIDYVEKRSNSGKGLGEQKLHSPYSEEYSDSLAFKAAGKSKSKITMRLSGDMMGSMDLLEENGSVIEYGFSNPEQAIKAYGHQTGFEGHPTIKGPKREFFGVTVDEIKKHVLPKFKSELERSRLSIADVLRSERAVEEQNLAIQTIQASSLFEDET